MPRMGISRGEIRSRIAYILMGFFTFYLVDPISIWMEANADINPIMFGIAGILLTLYFFDF